MKLLNTHRVLCCLHEPRPGPPDAGNGCFVACIRPPDATESCLVACMRSTNFTHPQLGSYETELEYFSMARLNWCNVWYQAHLWSSSSISTPWLTRGANPQFFHLSWQQNWNCRCRGHTMLPLFLLHLVLRLGIYNIADYTTCSTRCLVGSSSHRDNTAMSRSPPGTQATGVSLPNAQQYLHVMLLSSSHASPHDMLLSLSMMSRAGCELRHGSAVTEG
jgi:hypothetical protein